MESDHEEASVEGLSEEASEKAVPKKPFRRTSATGALIIPRDWPKWKKQCGAVRRGRPPCRNWAVVGMPTCKFHGSGGEQRRQLGQLRYLAWIVLGAPDNKTKQMPIEYACRISLALFAEYIFSDSSNVSITQRMNAAMWLTQEHNA